MSGAQATELSVANASLTIDAGASISGTGNISLSAGNLFLGGTLAGGSATISNSLVIFSPGSVFDAGPITFSGASNDLGVGPPNFIQINLETNNAIQVSGSIAAIGTQLSIAGTISGTGSLAVIDATELDGNNTYSGGTTLGLGVLAVGSANALGTGALSISGGELLATELLATVTETINNQLTMSGSFTIAAAHGQTLTFSSASGWSLTAGNNNVVTFGAPGQDGAIVWATPAGSSTNVPALYTVLVQAGTLRAADSGFSYLLENDQRTAIRPAATIDVAGFSTFINNLQGGGHITDSGAAAPLTLIGGNFSGVIGGPLALHTLSGALTLSGNNTYSGGTTIAGGTTLTLGAGGTTGSVPGAIFDLGVLAINRSDSFVVNNVSGNGQLQQIGPGVTTLGTGLSYTGGTLIAAGALVVSDPSALGSGGLTGLT
jgi:autotransporter-associated beta strand protein